MAREAGDLLDRVAAEQLEALESAGVGAGALRHALGAYVLAGAACKVLRTSSGFLPAARVGRRLGQAPSRTSRWLSCAWSARDSGWAGFAEGARS
jgi:hypothetical protein